MEQAKSSTTIQSPLQPLHPPQPQPLHSPHPPQPPIPSPETPLSLPQKPPPNSTPTNPAAPTINPTRLGIDSVYVIAQSVPNLPPLTNAAAAELAPDAEYRLREIIQDSLKFMKHSKRARLLPTDVSSALRLRNVKPIYGFGGLPRVAATSTNKPHLPFVDPTVTVGKPTLGLLANPVALSSKRKGQPHPEAAESHFSLVEGTDDLFFEKDLERTVKWFLQRPLPALPLEVTISAHWLAVEGSQPLISQNPVKKNRTVPDDKAADQPKDFNLNEKPQTEVKPVLRHDLSRELQMYYAQITGAILGHGDSKSDHLDACLESVAQEPGIVQAVPYLSRFIAEDVQKNMRDLRVLFSIMRLLGAMLDNPEFEMEIYLHQVLPPTISCVVSKRLCSNPREDHWALRDLSVQLVRKMCEKFSDRYPTFQPRVTKTFITALQDTKRSLPTHYGAIVGIASFGQQGVDTFIRPMLGSYTAKILRVLRAPNQKPIRRLEATKVFGALIWAVSVPPVMPNSLFPSAEGESMQVEGLRQQLMPHRISELLPNIDSLHSSLKEEMGSRLYPYGHGISLSKLAETLSENNKK